MEEREKVRPGEPQARPSEAEGDVEAHGRPAATEEPRGDGEKDDDVEAHGRPA